MLRLAIFAPPLGGHYGPYSNLAAELIARGHEVTFVHHEDARRLVEAAAARFVAVGKTGAPLENWTRPMARIRGILGLGSTIRRMEEFTTMLCREAPEMLRQQGINAVITDQLEPAGALVAEYLGLPWISIASTVPMNREPAIPPPFVNWGYEASPSALRRNAIGWRISDFILRSFNRCIERNATDLGLAPRRNMEDCFSPVLQIAQLVAGLDFPRTMLPAAFGYTGAFHAPEQAGFTLPPSDGRLTVYCTLGTLQGSRAGLFKKIARACARCGLRLVITHGRRGDPRLLSNLPGDPLVYEWVPQREVLRQVDLVISHGGMVTVLDTISAGIPMVVMPLAFEQPGIAARVAHAGAGLMLSRRASVSKIADALRAIASDDSFRARTAALALELKRAGGVSRAADLIEHALGADVPLGGPTRISLERDDARDDSRNGSRSAATGDH